MPYYMQLILCEAMPRCQQVMFGKIFKLRKTKLIFFFNVSSYYVLWKLQNEIFKYNPLQMPKNLKVSFKCALQLKNLMLIKKKKLPSKVTKCVTIYTEQDATMI